MSEKWIDDIYNKIIKKMRASAERNKTNIPYTVNNGRYDDKSGDIYFWTNGFWGGIMWHMYYATKDALYKEIAERTEEKLDSALYGFDGLHHDVGFMWLLSSVANYRLTGNEQSKKRGLLAASVLAGRYNLVSEHIRAWNEPDGTPGISIIDCMMNIPLLYWASETVNDPRYKYIAMKHADSTMKNHVRSDGSVRHIVYYDHINGGFVKEDRGQGYAEGSSWSRGQTWALYGFILSYIYTKKQGYLDKAKSIANYFISCVCDDWLPKCDFRSTEEPVIYDSTAGAIAASGLLELSKYVQDNEKKYYRNAAINLLKALEKNFCSWDEDTDGILGMGTERYHSDKGRHLHIIYGDYYFIEAIFKLKGCELLFW